MEPETLGGIGTGSGGGIGSAEDVDLALGEGGGGGVSASELVFAPDLQLGRLQGVCVVSLVADSRRVQVVRHVGMGLDQEAIGAAKHHWFKPATLQGKPVPVEVNIEVTFRIY